MSWKLFEWTGLNTTGVMSSHEIDEAIKYLRANQYPKPEDCTYDTCPGYRPACKLNICHVAIRLCGDF